VTRLADRAPVVLLEARDRFDEHDAYAFEGIPNVISAREWMQARTNLGVQTALIAHARCYVGTCGGLAWLAPFLGVPTVAVYADDSMLAPHLLVARQAGRRVSAADFTTLDLRALDRVGAAALSGVREDVHAGR
jgi:ADP-heptose:LPS heptosyltransferase